MEVTKWLKPSNSGHDLVTVRVCRPCSDMLLKVRGDLAFDTGVAPRANQPLYRPSIAGRAEPDRPRPDARTRGKRPIRPQLGSRRIAERHRPAWLGFRGREEGVRGLVAVCVGVTFRDPASRRGAAVRHNTRPI
jgi:hypothetical protein